MTAPIFLIASHVSENGIEAARRFLNKRRAEAEIIRFDHDLSHFRADNWVSPPAYARLYLDKILDSTWHRVLYLDADTRSADAASAPLLGADLDGRTSLGAVDNIRQLNHSERLSMADQLPLFQLRGFAF